MISSPARLVRMALMIGMPPPTEASNPSGAPCASPSENSASPCLASTSLLAVITGLPSSSARAINPRAGSSPPINSTTISTSTSSTSAIRSLEKATDAGMRSGFLVRLAMRVIVKERPARAASRVASWVNNSIRPEATVPRPQMPILISDAATDPPPVRAGPAVGEASPRVVCALIFTRTFWQL